MLPRSILLLCVAFSLSIPGVPSPAIASTVPSLIPTPQHVSVGQGTFALTQNSSVYAAAQFEQVEQSLRLLLGPATGFEFAAALDRDSAAVRLLHIEDIPPEGYRLHVGAGGIEIAAASDAGAFYALQTLRQLLPADIYSAEPVERDWVIPAVDIKDAPRFGWRGLHLDVGRHFMPLAFIKKYIDLLALHKMNTFHWHLTEDQGWRIEIKRYPKLTEVGSMRAQTVTGLPGFSDDELGYDGTPHGGFYTQEEVREVVAYAAARHVTVVPEIEFPGHAQAAIAAYPELGNTAKQFKVKEEWGISKNTLKPSDETLEFYRNVLTEVMELFPSQYIHIGGDEAPKEQWEESAFAQQRIRELGLKDENELQSWLIQQMDNFLTANGRKLVGWDEIMQGGLSSNATVMSWRGMKPGAKAAMAGHDVIMAPTTYTYLDYYQADDSVEPTALPFYLPLRDVYRFEPIPGNLPEHLHRHILGGQGQLWTEMMKTPEHVEYMAYPRAVALSEVLWSSPVGRDYEEFLPRLDTHLKRLDELEVNYRPPGNDELTFKGKIKQLIFKGALKIYMWWTGH